MKKKYIKPANETIELTAKESVLLSISGDDGNEIPDEGGILTKKKSLWDSYEE